MSNTETIAKQGFNPNQRQAQDFITPVAPWYSTISARTLSALGLSGPFVNGLDISHYNTITDFAKIKAAGYEFVIIKATEATDFVDPKFDEHWKGSLDAGLIVGAYHFFRGYDAGAHQAEHYLNTIEPLMDATGGRIIPPQFDVETSDGVTITTRRDRLLDALQTTQAFFTKPGVYSSPYLWSQLIGVVSWIKDYYGWVAHWTSAASPSLPVNWVEEMTKVWQWGVAGKHSWCPASIPGVQGNVDVNRFLGTLDQLKAWAGQNGNPPVPGECNCQDEIDAINLRITRLEEQVSNQGNTILGNTLSIKSIEAWIKTYK